MARYEAVTTKQRIANRVIGVLFFVYLVFFLDLLFLKNGLFSIGSIERTVNLIPLTEISQYFNQLGVKDAILNLSQSAGLFATMGIFISIVCKKKTGRAMLFALLAAIMVEVFQLLAACDIASIDGVIIGFVGGVIGILVDRILLQSIDKIFNARIVTSIVLLAFGAFIVLANFSKEDFQLNATREVYNEWIVEQFEDSKHIYSGICMGIDNATVSIAVENENTVVYQLDNNIQMVIRAEKKEYSEFGVLKNTIVVYEEVTKDQFMKLFTDSTKQITVYLDRNDRVDCLELLIEKN